MSRFGTPSGGAAVSVVCVAVTEFGSLQSLEHPAARVGESVPVSVQAQDCFGNVAPEFNGEVVVCSSHEVTGAGAVKLIDGVAHIMITSKAAGDVVPPPLRHCDCDSYCLTVLSSCYRCSSGANDDLRRFQ